MESSSSMNTPTIGSDRKGVVSITEALHATNTMSESMKSNRLGLVLVTGGTGFIGSHIVQQLILRGYPVRTTVRRRKSSPKKVKKKADQQEGKAKAEKTQELASASNNSPGASTTARSNSSNGSSSMDDNRQQEVEREEENDEHDGDSEDPIASLFRPFVHVTNIHRMLDVVEADLLYDHPENERYLRNVATTTVNSESSSKSPSSVKDRPLPPLPSPSASRNGNEQDANDPLHSIGESMNRKKKQPQGQEQAKKQEQGEGGIDMKEETSPTPPASNRIPTANSVQMTSIKWDGYSDWRKVFDKVEYVIHVASPYNSLNPDHGSQEKQELLDTAIEGTRRILQYCQATKTVKKLVITSCIQALASNFDPRKVYDENDWNKDATLMNHVYSFSKTAAERMAYTFCNEPSCHFKLVTILPGMVWGPVIVGRHLSFSHRFLLSFLNGAVPHVINFQYNISDVRDVAFAHIIAIERETIEGRYCLCNDPMSVDEVLQIVRKNFPKLKVPSQKLSDFVVRLSTKVNSSHRTRTHIIGSYLNQVARINTSKALQAGMILRPPAQTILDTVNHFTATNMISAPATKSRSLFSWS